MQKLNLSLMPMIAIFFAIIISTFSSYTTPLRSPDEQWFIYKGELFDKAQANSYTYTNGQDPLCSKTNVLCAIKVAADGNGRIIQSALNTFAINPGFSRPIAGKIEFRNNP